MKLMRYALAIYTLFISVTSLKAQASNVLNAYHYLQQGSTSELQKAKEYIDAAVLHEKTKNQAKTWYYRGQIYEKIYFHAKPVNNLSKPDAALQANLSYAKAFSFTDKVRIDQKDLEARMERMANVVFSVGIHSFNQKDYKLALEAFEETISTKSLLNITDTLTTYNCALTAEKLGEIDKAISYYKRCIELDYLAANACVFAASLYSAEGNIVEQRKILEQGLKSYPNNLDIQTALINYYLKQGEQENALALLKRALSLEANNSILYFSRGSLLQNHEPKQAEADFKKAIELDPDYFDALYNLGALYFNQGVNVTGLAAKETETNKYEKLKKEADELFNKALPYLEKALELKPSDRNTLYALLELYARNNNLEKYKEIKNILNN